MCVCVCVLSSHFYSGRQTCGRTSRGHTGGRSHEISPPSFCGACLIFYCEYCVWVRSRPDGAEPDKKCAKSIPFIFAKFGSSFQQPPCYIILVGGEMWRRWSQRQQHCCQCYDISGNEVIIPTGYLKKKKQGGRAQIALEGFKLVVWNNALRES